VAAKRAAKLGVPRPVRGSQPVSAEKPSVSHPGLVPSTISFSAPGFAYSHGLRKPSGGFPAVRSWSLSSATTDANIGVAADVPSSWLCFPGRKIATFCPYADTSGNPRPDAFTVCRGPGAVSLGCP
jgi:hypothetical protein